ncbi:DUF1700 domain-containing protein [Companilactobacillus sp. DQM5]|uniref:DUF1700 domain-containing protein n=1 Tax=Companilactobacillus sp. DQM5 TaxID=3463359 RepID=UPI00405810D9
MTRDEMVNKYIEELRLNITSLNEDEQKDILEFYKEFILDSKLNTPDAIVAELGTPKKLARKILADYSVIDNDEVKTVKNEKPKKNNQMKIVWIIILGLLAIPTAIPAGLGLLAILIGFFAIVFGLFIGFLGLIFGLIVGGIWILTKGATVLFITWSVGLFYLGIGIGTLILGLMIAPGAYYIIKILVDAVTSFAKYVGKKFFNKQYYKAKEEK